jgi:hypothetical protein
MSQVAHLQCFSLCMSNVYYEALVWHLAFICMACFDLVASVMGSKSRQLNPGLTLRWGKNPSTAESEDR